jgi:hypothetical protein
LCFNGVNTRHFKCGSSTQIPSVACGYASQLQERIKRLEEELNELRSDEAGLIKYNEELERRINRILEAGDKMFSWSLPAGQKFWNKAKEAKP